MAAQQEFARIGGVHQLQRPCVEHETAGIGIALALVGRLLRHPAYGMSLAVVNRFAQGFGDPHHHQQIAAGQARQAGIEGSKHIGLGVEMPRERRAREIDVVRHEHEPVLGKGAHG